MHILTYRYVTACCVALALSIPQLAEGAVLLGSRAALSVDGSPISLAAVDIDLDGSIDLVSANESGGDGASISVLRGFGNGSFHSEERLNLSPNKYIVHAVVGGDFDRDGTGDLAVAVEDIRAFPPQAVVLVYRNDGRGQFMARETYDLGGVFPRCLEAADVTGDGIIDIVACLSDAGSGDGLVVVLQGRPAGLFQVGAAAESGPFPSALEIADLDADGAVDLIAVDGEEEEITVLYGDGAGGFAPGAAIAVGVVATSARVIADADHDLPLLIVTSATHSRILRFVQPEARSFVRDAAVDVQDPPSDSVAVDVDGDGIVELVTTSATNRRIAVWQVVGGEEMTRRQRLTVDDAPAALLVADFDGDGRPDVAVAAAGADVTDVYLNGRSPASTPTAGPPAATPTEEIDEATATPTATPTSTSDCPSGGCASSSPTATATAEVATATPIATVVASTPTATPTAAPEPGDANCDGRIDSADISELIWQMFRPYCDGADVNGDGMMTAADIVLLMEILEPAS